MTNPKISIHDAITGESIEREMTAEELSAYEAKQLAKANAEAEKIAKAEAAQIAKEAAQAKLAALGLTTDDLKALGL